MRAYVVAVALLVACGSSQQPAQTSAPVALPSSPVASASAAPTKPHEDGDDAVARVQAIVPHMLELLARGEDERFIDEAVVPEELDKVLGNRTKQQLVADFKADKHHDVVEVLEYVRKAKPSEVSREDGRARVKYEDPRKRPITFVVDGAHVYIHN